VFGDGWLGKYGQDNPPGHHRSIQMERGRGDGGKDGDGPARGE